MRLHLAVLALSAMGCGGVVTTDAGTLAPDGGQTVMDSGLPPSDAGAATETCTLSTCDEAVGTWDTVNGASDAGTPCSFVQLPPVTIYRDGGALCTSASVQLSHRATKVLSSDGGCGLGLRITEVPATQSLYVAADQTWALTVSDGGFEGTNDVVVCCDVNCRAKTPISGTRR